jgi:hypothetical protein
VTRLLTTISPVRCDHFLEGADPSLAFMVDHDTFPVVTDPDFVGAAEAEAYMRPDDWIVGVWLDGVARCYPAWMLDNLHALNDTIAGRWYAVMHCEICNSNAVYHAELDGERVTFGTGGLFGGTLSVFDERTKSVWSHGMGVAFTGPRAGAWLPRVESFQATWAEWRALHPDTGVMVWPVPPQHPDARHGHGTDAWFAQPGIEPLVLRTMQVLRDERLPEHEIVVSLFTANGHAALPLRELARAGGLLASSVHGTGLVTLSAGADSALTGTYHPVLDDGAETPVELERGEGGRFVDRRTGSGFRVDGLAVSGPLAGRRLRPAPTMTNKWHSLICFCPGVEVLRAPEPAVPVDEGAMAPVIAALRAEGMEVRPERRMYALELPHEARCAVEIALDGEPFRLFLFADEVAAAEQLLWTPYALQAGPVVLASNPPLFTEWSNTRRIRPGEVAWSARVGDPALAASLARAAAAAPADPAPAASLVAFLDALRAGGVDVAVRRASYRETLPVRARTGVAVDVEGDPFVVFRFDSPQAAAEGAPLPAYSVVAGPFVAQSDPADMYAERDRGTQRRPDEAVSWSRLLSSEAFVTLVRRAGERA